MAKKKEMLDFTPVCNKCGKLAPIDEERSSDNWVVYRTKEPCECGGRFTPKCLLKTEEEDG